MKSNVKTIVLKPYNSPYFPVMATWDADRYSDVFESEQAARNAMIGRFGECMFYHQETLDRYSKALKAIGGGYGILKLPEMARKAILTAPTLEVKLTILEEILKAI